MSRLPPGPYEWINRDLMDRDGKPVIINTSCDPILRQAIAALPELVEALRWARDELSCLDTAQLQTHWCSHCDEHVDGEGSVRAAIGAALGKAGLGDA